MDIIFNPPENTENKYIAILAGQLRARGYRIHALDDFLSAGYRHFRSIKLVHLNWFENVDDRSFFIALRSFLRKMFVLTLIRFSAKKLVWTMHNRASHEKGLSFFSRTITWFLIRWSDRIIIHSHQTRELLAAQYPAAARKCQYIAHPHFIGVYAEVPAGTKIPDSENSHPLSLLFMGMVKPYKNMELLIDVVQQFPGSVKLSIAGRAVDPGYQAQLERLAARSTNIQLQLTFMPDDAIQGLIAAHDALVLPYDLASSLNSGTVLLAFSCKKTVICPEIGTISDLGEKQDLVFHYRYPQASAHAQALKQQIERAVQLKKNNPGAFRELGQQLYDHVQKTNSPDEAGRLLDHTYRSLIPEAP